jgi:hypothetical protein
MEIPIGWWLNKFSAIALLLLAGCAAASPVDESGSRISVTFIEPENFTDARCAELAPTSTGIIGELENFIITAGVRYVPKNMKLIIRTTDIDLAGDFECFVARKPIRCASPEVSTRRALRLSSRS